VPVSNSDLRRHSVNTVTNVQSGSTWVGETTLVGMTCPECGIAYAIPLRYRDQAYAEGHGKKQWFHGESEIERERAASLSANATEPTR
jgi:hypothetical protein